MGLRYLSPDSFAGGLMMPPVAGDPPDPPGEPPAFTSAPIIDNFNRANVSPLSSPWFDIQHDGETGSVELGIFGNIAAAQGDADASQVYGVDFGPDVDIAVTVVAGKQADGNVLAGLYVRNVPNLANPEYVALVVVRAGVTDSWQIIQSTNPGGVANVGSSATADVVVNDKVGLRVVGDQASGYFFHSGVWTEIVSGTITGPMAAGKIALRTEGNLTGFDDLQAVTL
jgi:hypothetical protein